MKKNYFMLILISIISFVLISCDINMLGELREPCEVRFYGQILEKETLEPLDSVKIEIESIEAGFNFMEQYWVLDTLYTDSLGGFDCNFTRSFSSCYKFVIDKEGYEVSSISPSPKNFPSCGDNEYYIEMSKIFPRELKLEVREGRVTYTNLVCIDSVSVFSSSSVIVQLPEVFSPSNNSFWPFQQLTWLAKDTFMLKDNSANLTGPYFANYQGNGFSFDTDSSIFKLRGDWQSAWDYGYHYRLARNNEENSFVEEKSGRGLLKQTTLDSLRNTLNENDTLYYREYLFDYEKYIFNSVGQECTPVTKFTHVK